MRSVIGYNVTNILNAKFTKDHLQFVKKHYIITTHT